MDASVSKCWGRAHLDEGVEGGLVGDGDDAVGDEHEHGDAAVGQQARGKEPRVERVRKAVVALLSDGREGKKEKKKKQRK